MDPAQMQRRIGNRAAGALFETVADPEAEAEFHRRIEAQDYAGAARSLVEAEQRRRLAGTDDPEFHRRIEAGDYAGAVRRARAVGEAAHTSDPEFHEQIEDGDYAGAVRGIHESAGAPVRSPRAPLTDPEAEFHQRVEERDYAGAVRHAQDADFDPVPPMADDLEAADPEFHRRVADRDYAGAVGHAQETDPEQVAAEERHRRLAERYRGQDDERPLVEPDAGEFHRHIEAGDYAGAAREAGGHRPLPSVHDGDVSGDWPGFHQRVEGGDYAGAVAELNRERPTRTLTGSDAASIPPPAGYDHRVHNDPVELPSNYDWRRALGRRARSDGRHPAEGSEANFEYGPTASLGDVGNGGELTAQSRDRYGNARGGSAQVTQSGVQLEGNWTPAGESGRRVILNVDAQRNAEGEVVGGDLGLSAGRGPWTGSLTGGYTFEVNEAHEQPDGSWTVGWTVSLRGGGGASGAGSRGTAGLTGRAHTTRTGTEVFTGSSREENLQRAQAFREDFENNAVREFDRALGEELGTVDWWIAQPSGTQRNIDSGWSLTPSAGAAILSSMSIGGSYTRRSTDQVSVSRGAGNVVTVVQVHSFGNDASLNAGSLVGISGGVVGDLLVRESFLVDMETGRESFSRLLSGADGLEEGQEGVRLRNRTHEETDGTSLGVNVMILGELDGEERTGERRETEYGPDGEETERVTQLGEQNFRGNNVFGDYARSSLRIEAPEGEGDYQIFQASHGTEGDESASMLGRASGEGRAGSRAESSGNWSLTETLSQADAERFHQALIDRYPEERGPPLGHPLGGIWDDLHGIDIGDRAGRAQAICAFVSSGGRNALRMVRSLSGTRDATKYVRLYGTTGEDLADVGEAGEDGADGEVARVHTFLGQHRSQVIERWIQSHREAEISPDDVTWARQNISELDARIARITDVDNFRDMPPGLRAEVVARYRRYRSSLSAIAGERGSQLAESMSEQGQVDHASFEALRERVEVAERRAGAARDEVIGFRRRWGQESTEGTVAGHLPPDAEARTVRLWSSAEGLFRGATDADERAEQQLSAGMSSADRGGEFDQLALYRSMTMDLELAESWFADAEEQMRALAGVYRPYVVAPSGLPDAVVADTEGEGDESSATGTTDREEPESRRRRRRRRRRRQREQPAPTAEGRAEPSAERPPSPPRIRLPHGRMRRCFRFGRSLGEQVQVLDSGPIELAGGGSLFVIRARYEPMSDMSAVRAQLGNDQVWIVDFEVQDPVPGGAETFTVTSSLSGPVRNAYGAPLTAYVRAPSNTLGTDD